MYFFSKELLLGNFVLEKLLSPTLCVSIIKISCKFQKTNKVSKAGYRHQTSIIIF